MSRTDAYVSMRLCRFFFCCNQKRKEMISQLQSKAIQSNSKQLRCVVCNKVITRIVYYPKWRCKGLHGWMENFLPHKFMTVISMGLGNTVQPKSELFTTNEINFNFSAAFFDRMLLSGLSQVQRKVHRSMCVVVQRDDAWKTLPKHYVMWISTFHVHMKCLQLFSPKKYWTINTIDYCLGRFLIYNIERRQAFANIETTHQLTKIYFVTRLAAKFHRYAVTSSLCKLFTFICLCVFVW